MPVNSAHRSYAAYRKQWDRCRDAYAGSDAVKDKGVAYLPMLEGMATSAAYTTPSGAMSPYAGYVMRALFYPALARTVAGLAGIVFGKPPTVLNVPTLYQQEFADVTLSGDSLAAFGLRLTIEDLLVGRVGVLVDFPDVEQMAAGAPPVSLRPYWSIYSAENVVNWQARRVLGKLTITMVILHETVEEFADDPFTPKVAERYRVLQLVDGRYTVTLWTQDATDKTKWTPGEAKQPTRRGETLTFIPFIPVGPTGVSLELEHPPMLDLVDVNYSHYRTSADQEHGAHFTALPTPYITGHELKDGETLGVGSGTAWVLPKSDAKVGMVEFSGAGLKSLAELKEEKRQLMASLGARMLETVKKAAETAEVVRLKHAGERSALSVLADAIGQALTQAVRWHLWWSGADDAVAAKSSITMNPDAMAELTHEEVTALVATWQAGAISKKTMYHNLEWGEWTRPNVTFEQEEEDIAAEELADKTPPAVVPPPPPPPAAA